MPRSRCHQVTRREQGIFQNLDVAVVLGLFTQEVVRRRVVEMDQQNYIILVGHGFDLTGTDIVAFEFAFVVPTREFRPVCPIRTIPAPRLVMQVAVRFSMRCSERRSPPP